MTVKPYHVVGGWAAFLTLLAGILAAYRGDVFSVLTYAGGIALVVAFGLVVLVVARRPDRGPQLRLATRSSAAAFTAIFLAILGLGFVYNYWIMPLGFFPLVAALTLLRGERLPGGFVPSPATTATEVSPAPARPTASLDPQLGTSVPLPPDHPARIPAPPPRRLLPRKPLRALLTVLGVAALRRKREPR